jgi:hypothetical protein
VKTTTVEEDDVDDDDLEDRDWTEKCAVGNDANQITKRRSKKGGQK